MDRNTVFAFYLSVGVGAVVTAFWAEATHWGLRRSFPNSTRGTDRILWVAQLVGAIERSTVTTLIIWLPQAVGPFAGALLAVKAVGGWGSLTAGDLEGRARYYVALINSMFSILWAVGCGLSAGATEAP